MHDINTSAAAADEADDIAKKMGPFGNCLFLAEACARGFEDAIYDEEDDDLLPYAQRN